MKADLHIHSHYSKDAVSSLRSIFKNAKKKNLGVIAITDHDTIKGAKEAKKMAGEFGIDVIIGEEIKSKEGDIIALFIEEEIESGRPVLHTLREIHKQGGLSIVPHPNNWFLEGISIRNLFKICEELDGIEVLNGSWLGKIGRKTIRILNDTSFQLAPIGSSDAHLASQVGCSYTIFQGRNATDLYFAIKQRRTIPAGKSWTYKDRLLWVINSPRIFYRSPKTLTHGVRVLIKNIKNIKKIKI